MQAEFAEMKLRRQFEFSAERLFLGREMYQDYTVCRAIDGHFFYLCSVVARNCQ